MVRLKFSTMQEARSVTVTATEGFRVAGNFMRKLPENEVIGEYAKHQWHVSGGHFSRYDAVQPVTIQFADAEGTPSQTFGPFPVMHVADGTMYTDDKLFAKFIDESLLWHSFDLETYWPNLIVKG